MFLQDEFISRVSTPHSHAHPSQLFQSSRTGLLWPRAGTGSDLKMQRRGDDDDDMFCGFCFARQSQIWFSVWLCKQACWHRWRAGSSISNRHYSGRLRWVKSCHELTVRLCGGQPVLLSPAQLCWFFFYPPPCFSQTFSFSLRYEIAFDSVVSFGKTNTFKYGWIYAGSLSG